MGSDGMPITGVTPTPNGNGTGIGIGSNNPSNSMSIAELFVEWLSGDQKRKFNYSNNEMVNYSQKPTREQWKNYTIELAKDFVRLADEKGDKDGNLSEMEFINTYSDAFKKGLGLDDKEISIFYKSMNPEANGELDFKKIAAGFATLDKNSDDGLNCQLEAFKPLGKALFKKFLDCGGKVIKDWNNDMYKCLFGNENG